ncbi:hypothetical protein L1987_77734 [Smallanthus sonchifolius]|uniref:Uncharacterized protein n=1 Tax=Smallanthus sonchifolius TaxID=185202 RepID=A0ACB8ZAS3_9ASTR|nr:hypothetical protein L1987_77734 [Smallanthus sonchifolius]
MCVLVQYLRGQIIVVILRLPRAFFECFVGGETERKERILHYLDEQISGYVTFGDGSVIEITGKGSVTVISKNGEKKTFCDVFYMPELKVNLLSLEQLDEEGHNIEIFNGILKLHDQKGRLLMKVQRNLNRMYKIKLKVCSNPKSFEDEKKESPHMKKKSIEKVKESPFQFGTIPKDLFGNLEHEKEKEQVKNIMVDYISKLSTEGENGKFEEPVKQVCYSQLKRRNRNKKKNNSRLMGRMRDLILN